MNMYCERHSKNLPEGVCNECRARNLTYAVVVFYSTITAIWVWWVYLP